MDKRFSFSFGDKPSEKYYKQREINEAQTYDVPGIRIIESGFSFANANRKI